MTLTLTPPLPQIPPGRSRSGSRGHPRGVRGHGARWAAHRPHPALWYTPLPGPVAQPALQTRRDQRAPDRAIAAEGIRTASPRPTRRLSQPTDQLGPRDSETTRADCHRTEEACRGISTFNVLVSTLLSLWVQYRLYSLMMMMMMVFGFFSSGDTRMIVDTKSSGFCLFFFPASPMRLLSRLPYTSELMGEA